MRRGDADLTRSQLYYLLQVDKEFRELQTSPKVNPNKIKVFMDTLDFSDGIIQNSTDQIVHFDRQVREYLESDNETIFIIFISVVNHWVGLVAHKKNYRYMDANKRR